MRSSITIPALSPAMTSSGQVVKVIVNALLNDCSTRRRFSRWSTHHHSRGYRKAAISPPRTAKFLEAAFIKRAVDTETAGTAEHWLRSCRPSLLPYGCPRSAAISVRLVPQPLFDNVNPRWSRLVVCRCLISLPLNSGPFSREHVFGSSSGEIRQETLRRGEALPAGSLKSPARKASTQSVRSSGELMTIPSA